MSKLVSSFIEALLEQSRVVKLDNGRSLIRDKRNGIWLTNGVSYPKFIGYTIDEVDIDEKFIRVDCTVYDTNGNVVVTDTGAVRLMKIGNTTVLNCTKGHVILRDKLESRDGYIRLNLHQGYYVVSNHHSDVDKELQILNVDSDYSKDIGDCKMAIYPVGEDHLVCDGTIIPLGAK